MKITIVFRSLNSSPNCTRMPLCAMTVSEAAFWIWSFVSPACSSNVTTDGSSLLRWCLRGPPFVVLALPLGSTPESDVWPWPWLLRARRCVVAGTRYGYENVVDGVLGRGSGVDSAEAAYGAWPAGSGVPVLSRELIAPFTLLP